MLFPSQQIPLDDQHWRRVNMRKVSHLIGAEMIHNLYDRYWPRINSLRFRHTITNFNRGVVESYAPIDEWTYLQHWLSKKFLALDPVLIREIEAIMNPTYDFVHEIMDKVDSTNLKQCTDQELALLLIDIMDFPLGDIYKLNVVQIEYSLNFALHKVLEKYEPNAPDRNELLAQLLAPGKLTVAQEEEVAFGKILAEGKARSIADPMGDAKVKQLIQTHYKEYAPTHCAYGEEPPVVQDYFNKYIFTYSRSNDPVDKKTAQANVKHQLEQSRKMLARLNDPRLTQLCDLMARIGVFRDWNKAKLGETVIRRLRILDEIARRREISRDALNYYLVAELTTLLDSGDTLAAKVIQDRQENGVCFIRNDEMIQGVQKVAPTKGNRSASEELRGICASPGNVEGIAKIVRRKEDIDKVSPGDIMVAVGTDFDLLEIMNISGGIITEEGGLLSHASVVSRELKKPCLIGVPQATQLLHDGDMLELNTTQGYARIMKRAT
jgi:phosphohistidine swiveling domain-containing protein